MGAALAIDAFLLLHYGLLATVLRFARGVRAADTDRLDCVLIDMSLLSWARSRPRSGATFRGLVALTLVPLALAYRSLAIPLVEATRIRPKTGLYNVKHLQAALGQELGRAKPVRPAGGATHGRRRPPAGHQRHPRPRSGRPGTSRGGRGAQAGHPGLRRGGALRRGRVLRPAAGTDLEGALVVAERMRALVEETTRDADVRVTVSIGAVAHRGSGVAAETLIAVADRAAYQAKASGRNAIAAAADQPGPAG